MMYEDYQFETAYLCLHFEKDVVDAIVAEYPGFANHVVEIFKQCRFSNVEWKDRYALDAQTIREYISDDLHEAADLLENAYHISEKFDFCCVEDYIFVSEYEYGEISITINPICFHDVMVSCPNFYSKLEARFKKHKWIKYLCTNNEELRVGILWKSQDGLCASLEQFMIDEVKDDNVYDTLEVHVVNLPYLEKQLEKYIKEYNERLVDKMFKDLEKRLNNMENAEIKGTIEKRLESKKQQVENFSYPVKYSPEMMTYIKELRQVSENLYQIGELTQVFSKNLLVSMDDGWGYSAFLKCIRAEFSPFFIGDMEEYEISEHTVDPQNGVSAWEAYPISIKKHTAQLFENNSFSIISLDMTDWMDQIEDKDLLNYIRRICQYATRSICVFRFPYMDAKTVRQFERVLSTVASIRSLIIPPVSIDNMVKYTKEKIREKNFFITDPIDDLLEQWIQQAKNADVFYGYKSLDKMAAELIYQKALSCADKKTMKRISEDDVKKMLVDSMPDKDPYQLLDELIGIDSVKQKIKEIVAQIKMQQAMVEQGKNIEAPAIHMMFLGNPGTGKTTVARIIGQIFKKEGILQKGHFIEKQGNSFVKRYIGQSVTAIREACRDAYGSVLFIDEAYGMSVGHSTGKTSDETLPVLVAEMENHRDSMCVIMAGYSDEMKEFVKENAGLASRIPHIIEFPNYTKEELVEILFYMIDGKFDYDDAFKDTVTDYILNLSQNTLESKEFSNARFIRNFYEHLWGKAAYRMSLTGETELVLKKEDAVGVIEEESFDALNGEKTRKIGFK